MRKPYVKNENLRKIMSEIYSEDEDIKEETIVKFINELKHSNLIIAGEFSNEISLTVIDYEGENYGVLFTDMDEFRKVFSTDEVPSREFSFHTYYELVKKEMVAGYVINPASESFLFGKVLLNELGDLPDLTFSQESAYTAFELNQIRKSPGNHELEEFIRNRDNIGKYDELFEMIGKSKLLTLLLSEDDLSEIAEDGVLSILERGPLGFLYIDEIGGEYATVYTHEDKMKSVQTDLYKYSQLVNFYQLAFFILNDDMDGIIINPNEENILISRDVLLEYASKISELCNDETLNTAIFHMFLIDD